MRPFTSINDPIESQPTFVPLKVEAFLKSLIRDHRDLPFVYLLIRLTVMMLPLAVLLFAKMEEWQWWILAIVYFVINNLVFKGPFGLMLHCTSHRKLFKKKYALLNHYIVWVIGPFFGQTPGTYYSHHIGMHHVENNLKNDLSSTMMYQRDSLKEFSRYFVQFFFLGVISTAKYFMKNRQNRLRNKILLGEVIFYIFCMVLYFLNPAATVVVFIIPFFLSRIFMILGNWTQHSFIDANDPANHYKNSITCINTRYNKKCWNDGYHTNHHLMPGKHFTEYPIIFQRDILKFANNQALVFENIEYLGVWWCLMRRDYGKLSKHLVNINEEFNSTNEAIEIMKERTKKIMD
ncbi:fatty acid desaturase family protein [Ekhidna sp.]|uniref:fatty acid desaturase family protein n=1 Tax=Ekhidna sp. TaxID=2608089 RepID=UPI003B514624